MDLARIQLFKCNQFKYSIFCRKVYAHLFFYKRFLPKPVFNEVLNRNDLEAKFFGYFQQLRKPGHRTIFIHDFHQNACGFKTRKPGKVYCGFRMSRTTKNTPLFSPQRKNMTRPSKVSCHGLAANQCLDSFGPVLGRNTCSTTMPEKVNTDRECSFM